MSFFRLQLDCCLQDILIDHRALPKSRLELKHAAVTVRLQNAWQNIDINAATEIFARAGESQSGQRYHLISIAGGDSPSVAPSTSLRQERQDKSLIVTEQAHLEVQQQPSKNGTLRNSMGQGVTMQILTGERIASPTVKAIYRPKEAKTQISQHTDKRLLKHKNREDAAQKFSSESLDQSPQCHLLV
ncbi:hypothetical protein Cgig2_018324 [Carnegiea gigantea]|uniref:Uncharacterized protein n=1 Tax=Carnegiea gigantea TaxID=171969 RepID=A0A9Q1KZ19_9CARY|nr:hypothetical protein Cgig2_018324 [Carnegiea gigantea]